MHRSDKKGDDVIRIVSKAVLTRTFLFHQLEDFVLCACRWWLVHCQVIVICSVSQERDPKLEAWLSKNTWFGKDSIMTGAARALHETLVAEEGFDPRTDEYYAEIDKRMRRELPNKFQGDKKNVQSVTPAGSGTRSLKSGRKKSVELNPGQVALAQKLNIPLEKYAAEVAKLENRRD